MKTRAIALTAILLIAGFIVNVDQKPVDYIVILLIAGFLPLLLPLAFLALVVFLTGAAVRGRWRWWRRERHVQRHR
jgi:hypothetical protein